MHRIETLKRLNKEAAGHTTSTKPDFAAERAYHHAALSDEHPESKTLVLWRRALELGLTVTNLGLSQ